MAVEQDPRQQLYPNRYGLQLTFSQLKESYIVLGGFAGRAALADLAEFCGANDPAPVEGDTFKQGRAAGRRDVWLHVQQFLQLTDREIMNLMARRPVGVR